MMGGDKSVRGRTVHCPECQQANSEDARFCLRCGIPLGSDCAVCGARQPPGGRFCVQCGDELIAATETDGRVRGITTATPATPATKRRATSIADERRLVTVLFADVVGSTRLAENLDVEDWKALINGAFEVLTVPIHRYGGTIAQFLGDGFLAFFGAPVAHEDDAHRAVRASLELIDAARAYGDVARDRFGLDFAVRIGIHSGPVVVGSVGTDQHQEYLAMGDTVNVAARLQAAARPMSTLISERTRRLVSNGFEMADEGLIEVRGRAEPVRAFTPRLLMMGMEPDQRPAPLASPMVGRASELERLVEASRATRAGVGRLVVILGEPGIGKSTLLREWRSMKGEHGTRWAQANMPAHATAVAYHLAGETIRAMLGLRPEADASELESAVRSAGAEADFLDVRPDLAGLLSMPLPEGSPDAPEMSPQGRQARYVRIVGFVVRAVARSPTVLVLNDVHWADASSVALLAQAIGLHRQLPLLVAVVARPDPDVAGWRLVEAARESAGAGLVEISLEPLPADDGDQLLANLIGHGDVPAPLIGLVRTRGEGNPLFVEEIVRMLIERALLVRDGDAWQLRATEGADIPDTLQGLLAARIDRLDPEARNALRVASVIGRQFPAAVLERLLEWRMSMSSVLARLEGAGLIRLARTDPQVEYLFRHALIHDAAYQSVGREQRRALHLAAGEILEELLADRRDELASTLAYHFARADVPDRAAGYQLRAAERAAASFANAEAIGFYRDALASGRAGSLAPEDVASGYERLGGVLELVGRLDEAIAAYGDALERTDIGDVLTRARLVRRQANAHRIARHVNEARALFESSAAQLDEIPEEDRSHAWWTEQLDVLLDRAWLHYFWGPLEEMARALDGCAGAIDRYASDAQRTRYYARLSLLTMRGNHMIFTDEALALSRAAYDAWEATGDPTDVELARFQLGLGHLMRGEVDAARRFLGESLSAAELTGDVVLQSRCLTYLALAARFAGDVAEMERIHDRAMPVLSAGGMTEYLAIMAANRCWAAWRRGDLPAAEAHGAAALELGAQLPGKYAMEWTVRLPLLAMALERDDVPGAIEQAVELGDEAWVDEEYGRALHAGLAANAAGDGTAREHLESVVEQARRGGRL